MTLDPHTAAEMVDACAALTVALGVLLAITVSIPRMIVLVAIQAVLVGAAALTVGAATGTGHLVVGGLLAVGVKGIAVPLVLATILRRAEAGRTDAGRTEAGRTDAGGADAGSAAPSPPVTRRPAAREVRDALAGSREGRPVVNGRVALVAAVAIIFVAAQAADGIVPGASLVTGRALPAGMAEVLTGLFIVMTRRMALSLVVGLLVFENGIALTAFSLTYGMPLVVEFGILFDLLIVVIVAWVYARRMLDVFGTLSTDELRSLRG